MPKASQQRKSSPIWHFFEECEGDEMKGKAKCKLCSAAIGRGSKDPKCYNTSNMQSHMKIKHSQEFHSYMRKLQNAEDKSKPTESHEKILTSGPSASGSSSVRTHATQPKIESAFDKIKVWDIDNPKAAIVHKKIGEMIATDNQPFSIVEDLGFRRLIAALEPHYQLPSRKYFSTNVIPTIYDKVHEKVEGLLQEAGHITFTTDIWTAKNSENPYLSLTGHWITPDFQRRSSVLSATHFPGSHTAANVKTTFEDMLDQWKVDAKNVHLVLHDGARNMNKGIEETGISHETCFIHTLQLVIHDSVFMQRSVLDLIAIGRKIVGHFKHSAIAVQRLEQIQIELGLQPLRLVQDVPTRWNSTCQMLKRLYKLRRIVGTYALDHDIPTLSAYQWELMDKVLHLLEPLEEITETASKADASLSMVIPTVQALERFFSKQSCTDSGIGTMKESLRTSISKRFSYCVNKEIYVLSTLLDPRYKTNCFSEITKEKASDTLIQRLLSSNKDNLENQPSEVHDEPVSETTIEKGRSDDFWKCFDDVVSSKQNSNPITSTAGSTSKKELISLEVKEYLNLSTIDRQADPLEWWKRYREVFPHISESARCYLAAPPSSVDSERMFSIAGDICEGKRSSMSPAAADRLLFLHCNLRLLNFQY